MAKTKTTKKAKGKPARKSPPKGKPQGKAGKKGNPFAKAFGKAFGKPKAKALGKGKAIVARGARKAPAPRRAVPVAPSQPDVARPTALAIANAALDKKGEDVVVLDVRGLTSYADYFVVITADSDRQASAIADSIEQAMKAQGVSKVGVEGYESGRWVLVDYGDVVAHVMNRESRGFYDLEGLWADAPRFTVKG